MLARELATASNIKSKHVRKHVIAALKSGMYKLKTYKKSKAPENGLILCCGDILVSQTRFDKSLKKSEKEEAKEEAKETQKKEIKGPKKKEIKSCV